MSDSIRRALASMSTRDVRKGRESDHRRPQEEWYFEIGSLTGQKRKIKLIWYMRSGTLKQTQVLCGAAGYGRTKVEVCDSRLDEEYVPKNGYFSL